MEDMMGSDAAQRQRFIITIDWSEESNGRLTEGDLHEAIELLALEVDEDVTLEVIETMEIGD